MPVSNTQSMAGMLPTPGRTPSQGDNGSPAPSSDVQLLFEKVRNLQNAVLKEHARRSKVDHDIRDSLRNILTKVEHLMSTTETQAPSDDIDSEISSLPEISFAEVENDTTQLPDDSRVGTLDRRGRLRDDRGLFLKRKKPIQQPSTRTEESKSAREPNDLLQYIDDDISVTGRSRSSSEGADEDNIQDTTLEEQVEDESRADMQDGPLQYHFVELGAPDAPARSTRAATEKVTAKEPSGMSKDSAKSTTVPTAKKGATRKDKKASKEKKTATASRQKEPTSKAGKPYSEDELQLIGSSVAHLLSTTDMPRIKVFEKVAEDIKSQGYNRTVGTLQVRWYTQLQAIYPTTRPSQKTVVEHKIADDHATAAEHTTDADDPAQTHKPSTEVSTDHEAAEDLQEGMSAKPSVINLLQGSRNTTAVQDFRSISKTSLDRKLLRIRLGDSVGSTRSTRKLIPEFSRNSSRFFVATNTWT
jgi:hypothetical protein